MPLRVYVSVESTGVPSNVPSFSSVIRLILWLSSDKPKSQIGLLKWLLEKSTSSVLLQKLTAFVAVSSVSPAFMPGARMNRYF